MKNINKAEALAKLATLEKDAMELRKIIEDSDNTESINITDRVNNYDDILEISGVVSSDDEVKVKGFDEAENKVVKAFIKKMRTVKVYNQGWFPKKGDRRWYPWFDVSSGFVFDSAGYDVTYASSGSASRLCLKDEKLTLDYVKKFIDIERDLIDLS